MVALCRFRKAARTVISFIPILNFSLAEDVPWAVGLGGAQGARPAGARRREVARGAYAVGLGVARRAFWDAGVGGAQRRDAARAVGGVEALLARDAARGPSDGLRGTYSSEAKFCAEISSQAARTS